MAIISKTIRLIIVSMLLTSCVTLQITREQSLLINDTLSGQQKVKFFYVLFDDPAEKQKGLSNTEQLNDNEAALFALSDYDKSFWMKGMKYNIDIVFVDEDMKIIQMLNNLEVCTEGETCPKYNVPDKASYAIEIPAGSVATHKINTGDTVSL